MLTLAIDKRQMRQLQSAIDGTKKKLEVELKIAVRATAKKSQTIINQNVRKELNVKAKDVVKHITSRTSLQGANPSARVILKKSARLPLKAFNARQTKAGVSYKVSKSSGRSKAKSAFMGPRPGQIAPKLHGHVFRRQGESRLPIVKLHGASPWGAFVKRRMRPPTTKEIRIYLSKQIDRRVRAAIRKKQGSV